MRLDRDAILKHLRERDRDRADRAERDLPHQLDHEQHGGLLQKLGLDPAEMLERFEARHPDNDGGRTSAESPMPIVTPDAPPPGEAARKT